MSAADEREYDGSEYGLAAIWRDVGRVSYLTPVGIARQTVAESFRTVLASPVTSALSLISISAALFLLGFFLLVFQNTSELLQRSSSDVTVSIYLADSLDEASRNALFDSLVALEEVQEVQLWNKEKALKEFQSAFQEFDGLVEGLAENNPLPASFELRFRPNISHERYVALAESFRELPDVEHVRYEQELVEQLAGLLGFIKRTGAAAVLVVLVITGFVIASTIRLALFYRQDELAIMRLVGASSWFIRVPCLIEGVLYGCAGSLLGLLLLFLFQTALRHSMSEISLLSPIVAQFEFLSLSRIVLVLVVGVGVGLAASYFAARKVASE